MRRFAMLLAAVALLAACGDSKKPAAGPQLSHADYVRQADAACQRADAALASLAQPAGIAQLPSYAKQASDIVAAEREALQALQAPAADRATAGQLAAAMDEVAKAAEGLIAIAGGGNAQDIEAYVSRNRGIDAKAQQLAHELGMTVCARP